MVVPVPRVWLLDGIEALHRRSLVETGGPGGEGQGGSGTRRGTFTLQSVVLEYVTERLVSEVSREIEHGRPRLLIEHGLTLAQVPEYARQTQERLIAVPILQTLRGIYRRQG